MRRDGSLFGRNWLVSLRLLGDMLVVLNPLVVRLLEKSLRLVDWSLLSLGGMNDWSWLIA